MALTGRPALSAAAAFAALAAVASRADADGLLARADRAAYEKVRASRREPAVAAARRVSALAEPTVIYPVVVAVGLRTRGDTRWRRAATACMVVAAGAATRRQLSRLIARPRPPAQAWLIAPEGYSLPSKHTTVAVLAVGVSVHSLGVTGAPAAAARLVTAAAVGASRIYLGVHWPADVVAGWLFAEGWLRLTRPAAR
jgi:membrane-associated phospholipid phosphatase